MYEDSFTYRILSHGKSERTGMTVLTGKYDDRPREPTGFTQLKQSADFEFLDSRDQRLNRGGCDEPSKKKDINLADLRCFLIMRCCKERVPNIKRGCAAASISSI